MKFKQYLTEVEDVSKILKDWAKPYRIEINDMRCDANELQRWFESASSKLKLRSTAINVAVYTIPSSKAGSVVWDWPADVNLSDHVYFEINGDFPSIEIEDFENVPHAQRLKLENVKIKSLKGIEKNSNLEEFEIVGAAYDLEGGVLRLLKCKALQRIKFQDNLIDIMPKAHALSIVNKHLKDKDIIECQTELMDAGLEEFAKL